MSEKTLCVNFFGGPSSGKSTLSASVFSLLKMHQINCELITEYAKELTWENNVETLENQPYVWANQYHRMRRVAKSVDIIVTDSPLPLNIVYNTFHSASGFGSNFVGTILDSFEQFENINYMIQRSCPYCLVGRNQTEDESKRIDRMIIDMLEQYNIPFEYVLGNISGINSISLYLIKNIFSKQISVELSRTITF